MKKEKIFLIVIGFFAGMISGFFGAGGGLLLVPFFDKILKINPAKSRANAIFIILFFVIVSSFFYFKTDNINFGLGIKCALGGIIGSFIGSKLLIKLDGKILNLIFIIFLFYSGIRLL